MNKFECLGACFHSTLRHRKLHIHNLQSDNDRNSQHKMKYSVNYKQQIL